MNRKPLSNSLIAALFAASAFTVTFASVAEAQAPTKAAAAGAPAAAAPAPAAPITPEQRSAIRELLEITHTREGVAGAMQGMSQGLRPQIAQMVGQRIEINTALSPEQKQQVRAGMQQPFEAAVTDAQKILNDPKVVDDVVERLIGIYARTFTLDEIKQLVTFYKSPVGQKAITAVPTAGREAMQGMMTATAPKIDALVESTVQKQIDVVAKGAAPAAAPAPAKAAPTKK